MGPQGGGTVDPPVGRSKSSRPSRKAVAQRKVPAAGRRTSTAAKSPAQKPAAKLPRARPARKAAEAAVARGAAETGKDEIVRTAVAEQMDPEREISFSRPGSIGGGSGDAVDRETVEDSTPDEPLLERSQSIMADMWDKCVSFFRSLVGKK
ncbi:MAG: hypothetical protein AB8U44_02070 [Aaplasma endosymbiont of Hyalomma asiaticum]